MSRNSAKQGGALWRHTNKNVGVFMTGILDLGGLGEVPIAIFRNDRKEEGTKQPDYRIVLSEKRSPVGENGATGADPIADGEEQPAESPDEMPF